MSYKRPDLPPPIQRRARARREIGGRRKTDSDPRSAFSVKLLTFVVFAINLFYLVVEFALNRCIEVLW